MAFSPNGNCLLAVCSHQNRHENADNDDEDDVSGSDNKDAYSLPGQPNQIVDILLKLSLCSDETIEAN